MGTALTFEHATTGLLTEIEEAFFDIPFDNSDFQIQNFVVASSITPARAYRAIGLQMVGTIERLREALFKKELAEVDLDEQRYLAETAENPFERRRAAIKVRQMEASNAMHNKLINDALHQLDVLYAEFKKFPKLTRADFEAEERTHFEEKLTRQIEHGGGAVDALLNMHQDVNRIRNAIPKLHANAEADPLKVGVKAQWKQ